mmetsp:Transcript_56626/g.66183  ORF Transcript_56626/g.66183 Transcript_56626/m.66183 type:complete len:202 (-) Transcript_56626:887-1492(-)
MLLLSFASPSIWSDTIISFSESCNIIRAVDAAESLAAFSLAKTASFASALKFSLAVLALCAAADASFAARIASSMISAADRTRTRASSASSLARMEDVIASSARRCTVTAFAEVDAEILRDDATARDTASSAAFSIISKSILLIVPISSPFSKFCTRCCCRCCSCSSITAGTIISLTVVSTDACAASRNNAAIAEGFGEDF